MRAFGKDRARETQAPARSIPAAVPTPLGPPVGCHPTPSDGIAHANHTTMVSKGKGLTMGCSQDLLAVHSSAESLNFDLHRDLNARLDKQRQVKRESNHRKHSDG